MCSQNNNNKKKKYKRKRKIKIFCEECNNKMEKMRKNNDDVWFSLRAIFSLGYFALNSQRL